MASYESYDNDAAAFSGREKKIPEKALLKTSPLFFPLPRFAPQRELCQICETPSSLFLLARMCEMLAGYMLGEWKARKAQTCASSFSNELPSSSCNATHELFIV